MNLTMPAFPRNDSALLDQVFDHAPSFMAITVGPEHKYLKINRKYQEHILTADVIGRTVAEALPEVVGQGFIDLLDKVYASGEPYFGYDVPIRFGGPGGRLTYADFAYQPLRDEDGKVAGIMVQGFDVTEKVLARRAIENERQNFRSLFRQTPEMVCITRGPEHVFEFVNEAHIRVLGFDATGKAVREAQPESVEVHGILDAVYETGKTAELRQIPVTVADRLRYFNLTYAARYGDANRIEGVMILGVEITDQLENERKLQDSVRTRDEFISIASHELKTPITSLKLSTQVNARRLRLHRGQALDEAQLLKYFDGNLRQLERLSVLVEDMLDVSRLASGKLAFDFQPVNVGALAREVFDRFAEQFSESDVSAALQLKASPVVHGDSFRLEQVLTNLLTNALKYGNGKPVRVEVTEEEGLAAWHVTDQGIGISAAALPTIFDRFERAISARNISGLGLGLYITRQIVEAHGGRVNVESVPGQGSRFSVYLPIHAVS
jgi:signal transduction histidine kinase